MAFFDLETTGLNISKDKIVEISILKIRPDESEETYTRRINPGIQISEESIAIHGITNAAVKNEPTFGELANEIKDFLGDADLAGYNSNRFDIPFLLEELLNHNVEISMENRRCIDVQTVFHKMEQRTLSAAYKFYCDQTIENAHSAEADTRATFEILKAQIDRYPEVENDIDFLEEFTQQGANKKIDFVGRLAMNEKGDVLYNFGKHNGKTLQEVYKKEPGYHRWIMDNDFPLITKKILDQHISKIILTEKENRTNLKMKAQENLVNKIDQLKNKFNQ